MNIKRKKYNTNHYNFQMIIAVGFKAEQAKLNTET